MAFFIHERFWRIFKLDSYEKLLKWLDKSIIIADVYNFTIDLYWFNLVYLFMCKIFLYFFVFKIVWNTLISQSSMLILVLNFYEVSLFNFCIYFMLFKYQQTIDVLFYMLFTLYVIKCCNKNSSVFISNHLRFLNNNYIWTKLYAFVINAVLHSLKSVSKFNIISHTYQYKSALHCVRDNLLSYYFSIATAASVIVSSVFISHLKCNIILTAWCAALASGIA